MKMVTTSNSLYLSTLRITLVILRSNAVENSFIRLCPRNFPKIPFLSFPNFKLAFKLFSILFNQSTVKNSEHPPLFLLNKGDYNSTEYSSSIRVFNCLKIKQLHATVLKVIQMFPSFWFFLERNNNKKQYNKDS